MRRPFGFTPVSARPYYTVSLAIYDKHGEGAYIASRLEEYLEPPSLSAHFCNAVCKASYAEPELIDSGSEEIDGVLMDIFDEQCPAEDGVWLEDIARLLIDLINGKCKSNTLTNTVLEHLRREGVNAERCEYISTSACFNYIGIEDSEIDAFYASLPLWDAALLPDADLEELADEYNTTVESLENYIYIHKNDDFEGGFELTMDYYPKEERVEYRNRVIIDYDS